MSGSGRVARWVEHRRSATTAAAAAGDEGRAIIEVVVLGVLVLIPTLYILIALLRLQAATLAVNQAARDAGRAIDAAGTVEQGLQRAVEIAVISLRDQNVPSDGVSVHFASSEAGCSGPGIDASLQPGAVYDVCVTVPLTLPGVPSVLTGTRNTATGEYTLHVGEFREGR